MDYELAFFDWDGKLISRVSRPVPKVGLSRWRVEFALKQARLHPFPGTDTSAAGLRRIRSMMESTPLPGFSPSSTIGLDGAGRVLVAGIEGDSAFVDFFSPPRYLGRLGVPCRGFESRWAVQGQWIAFVCRPTDPNFPGDATVRLFQIIG